MTDISADTFNKVVLAGVALVSLVVSPWLQWLIAQRQANLQKTIAQRIAADNISAKRQNWIDELRKDMAEFLTATGRLNELRRPAANLPADDQKKNFEDMATYNFRAHELGVRIKLRLNPKEAEHNTLVDLLTKLSEASKDPVPNETPDQRKAAEGGFTNARDAVISHVQTILKHEWERVKAGKL